jgi:hypothetical protein
VYQVESDREAEDPNHSRDQHDFAPAHYGASLTGHSRQTGRGQPVRVSRIEPSCAQLYRSGGSAPTETLHRALQRLQVPAEVELALLLGESVSFRGIAI